MDSWRIPSPDNPRANVRCMNLFCKLFGREFAVLLPAIEMEDDAR